MKVFIAYRFTGEDPAVLEETLQGLTHSLEQAGHTSFNSLANETQYRTTKATVQEIMRSALDELDQADALLAFVNSDHKSEGMLIEVGYAVARGKPVILAKRRGTSTFSVDGVADYIYEFDSLPELYEQVRTMNFDKREQ